MTREDTFQFIVQFWRRNGVSPTVAEVAEGIGRVKSVAYYHINNLIRDGRIDKYGAGMETRSYRVVGWRWDYND